MGQQVVMFGRYNGSGELGIELKAKISGEQKTWSTTAQLPETDQDNPELERLWALSRVDGVMEQIRETGETENLRQQVVDLGTAYSLVTDHTSMLVVQDAVLENQGIDKRNADRVQRERQAQQQRPSAPVKTYQVDRKAGGGMFKGLPSPGIGSGPVGPLFIGVLAWLNRRKKMQKD